VKTRTLTTIAAGALAALALALVLAGCGNSGTTTSSPSTIFPQSSATGTLPALKAYLTSAQDILGQVATTVGQLPGAVGGMSVKPDSTWQSSGSQLDSIATQLGQEASALAALQPPSALQPVQDAVVKGIQAAQSGVQNVSNGQFGMTPISGLGDKAYVLPAGTAITVLKGDEWFTVQFYAWPGPDRATAVAKRVVAHL